MSSREIVRLRLGVIFNGLVKMIGLDIEEVLFLKGVDFDLSFFFILLLLLFIDVLGGGMMWAASRCVVVEC